MALNLACINTFHHRLHLPISASPSPSPCYAFPFSNNCSTPSPFLVCSSSPSRTQVISTQQNQESTLNETTSPSSSKRVLVVGGTGGVGQLVVASLLDRNIKARLILRNPEKAEALFGKQDEDKLQVYKGDTRDETDLHPSIFEGVTHVICCTGTTAFPSRRWDGDNTPEKVGQNHNFVLAISS